MQENTTPISTTKDRGFLIKSLLQNNFFVNLMKFAILVVLLWVLYYQIFGRTDLTLQDLMAEFTAKLSWTTFPLAVVVAFLMPLNWYFETKKWSALMQTIEPVSWQKTLQAVLFGLSISMFTPNRVGEYGGRLVMVRSENRLKALFAVMVGVSSQWIVLVVSGWWALVLTFAFGIVEIIPLFLWAIAFWGLIGTIFLFFLYFNLQASINYCLRFKWTNAWAEKMQAGWHQYSHAELLESLGYSTIRFWIYTFQYLLLLCFFGFDASLGAMLLGVMIVYLLQTGIPLPPSTGLIARGNIAILIFGYFSTDNSIAVLASTFSLWLINVVLPAILGAFWVGGVRVEAAAEKTNFVKQQQQNES